MLVASRTPLQVGTVTWDDESGAVTVVVKRTYDLVPRGQAVLSTRQEPLRLDTGRAETLLFPTDFAPTKALCDVVVVGSAVEGPVGPVRVVLDPLRKLAPRAALLGPRAGVGAEGDPTDPDLLGAWTSPSFEFEAFQCAPPDQRVPLLALPFSVTIDYGEARYVTRVDGRAPEAVIVDQLGWSAPTPVLLRVDLVGIDPEKRRLVVLWRGIGSVTEGAKPLLAVEVDAPIRSLAPRAMLGWPRYDAIVPTSLRTGDAYASPLSEDTHALRGQDDPADDGTLTMRRGASERADTSEMPAVGHTSRDTRPSEEEEDDLSTTTGAMALPKELQAVPFGGSGLPFARNDERDE